MIAARPLFDVESDWLAWPGWGFVGTVAQVVSLAALLFAAYELAERRRAFPPVYLTVNVFGSRDVGSRSWHVAELINAGNGGALIHTVTIVDGKWNEHPHKVVRWSLASGQRSVLEFEAPDLGRAWLLILYSNLQDRRHLFLEWSELAQGGYADREMSLSLSRKRQSRLFEGGAPSQPWGLAAW